MMPVGFLQVVWFPFTFHNKSVYYPSIQKSVCVCWCPPSICIPTSNQVFSGETPDSTKCFNTTLTRMELLLKANQLVN